MKSSRPRTLLPLLTSVALVFTVVVGQENGADVKIVKMPYDQQKLLKSLEHGLSDEAYKGRALWLQRCAFCHDGVGTPTYNTIGPWLDSEVVKARGDANVRAKILKGSSTMPGFQYGLTAAQVDQVIAFLKTISPDQKPTPEQKAGKARLPGSDL